MNKAFITSVIIIIAVVGGFFALNKYIYIQKQGDMTIPKSSSIEVTPIEHATMMLKWGGKVIYTDPVGGASAFAGKPEPDLILLTDIHGDHLDEETLNAVSKEKTVIIAPKAVVDELSNTPPGTVLILNNGETLRELGFTIEAIPMYNIPESADSYHAKGRGNGYVLESGGKRIYISGDTSGVPEMRALKDIDMAFVCMNLPYTMGVDEAVDAVLAFKPKQVYPYHYRGTDGLSDVNRFKELVTKEDPNIQVMLLNWYPN